MSMRLNLQSWRAQQRLGRLARTLILVGVLFVFALPLAWSSLAALGINPNRILNKSQALQFTFEHFAEIGLTEPNFVREMVTSALIAIGTTALALLIGFPAAHVLARARFRSKAPLTHSLLVLASLPVMAYVIPLSDVLHRLHLLDTLIGLVLAQAAAVTPWVVYVLMGYISALPVAIDEAAMLEGATPILVAVRIVLPAVLPQVIATAVIVAALCWNAFLLPLVLAGASVKTVPVAMSDFFTFERELEWPTAAAALVASLSPLIALLVAASHALLQFELRDA